MSPSSEAFEQSETQDLSALSKILACDKPENAANSDKIKVIKIIFLIELFYSKTTSNVNHNAT